MTVQVLILIVSQKVRLVMVARVVLSVLMLVMQPGCVHVNFSSVLTMNFLVLVQNVHLLLMRVFLVLMELILVVRVHVLGVLVVRVARGRVH